MALVHSVLYVFEACLPGLSSLDLFVAEFIRKHQFYKAGFGVFTGEGSGAKGGGCIAAFAGIEDICYVQ